MECELESCCWITLMFERRGRLVCAERERPSSRSKISAAFEESEIILIKDINQRYLQHRRIRNNFADDEFMPMLNIQEKPQGGKSIKCTNKLCLSITLSKLWCMMNLKLFHPVVQGRRASTCRHSRQTLTCRLFHSCQKEGNLGSSQTFHICRHRCNGICRHSIPYQILQGTDSSCLFNRSSDSDCACRPCVGKARRRPADGSTISFRCSLVQVQPLTGTVGQPVGCWARRRRSESGPAGAQCSGRRPGARNPCPKPIENVA